MEDLLRSQILTHRMAYHLPMALAQPASVALLAQS
jgi:hypothetical protein